MKFAVLDTETTGLEGGSRPVEIAAIVFNEDSVIDRFETLINPHMPIPADTVKIHGITDAMVADAPSAREALASLWERIPEDAVLVAHYAPYDTGIISWASAHAGIEIPNRRAIVDTCSVAQALKKTKNNKLDTLVAHYGIERRGTAHRAMCDADACMDCFSHEWDAATHISARLPWSAAGHDYSYFDVSAVPPTFPDVSFLPALVATGAPFSFVYEDDKGVQTERTITPLGWALKNSNYYFHGKCHLRSAETGKFERRSFRVDRIVEVLSKAA